MNACTGVQQFNFFDVIQDRLDIIGAFAQRSWLILVQLELATLGGVDVTASAATSDPKNVVDMVRAAPL